MSRTTCARLKHFWNPAWCVGDLFLDSTDTQVLFIWLFGWVTKFVSLTATAWIGRVDYLGGAGLGVATVELASCADAVHSSAFGGTLRRAQPLLSHGRRMGGGRSRGEVFRVCAGDVGA